ncbi:10528_t:CDS:2, partial [Cetraspora pellucida]
MPYNKIGKITYMFCLNIVDIASRYKASVPIGGIISNINISWLKAKDINALFSLSRNGPVEFDEPQLSYNISVRYLLEPGELEGRRHYVTDCNWSPQKKAPNYKECAITFSVGAYKLDPKENQRFTIRDVCEIVQVGVSGLLLQSN